MATHSRTLAWRIPWTQEPGRLQSVGSLRVGHDWATSLSLFTFMHWKRQWQPTPVFLPGESQGWGKAAVYGVAQSRTRLKRLSSSSIGKSIFYFTIQLHKTTVVMCISLWCISHSPFYCSVLFFFFKDCHPLNWFHDVLMSHPILHLASTPLVLQTYYSDPDIEQLVKHVQNISCFSSLPLL